ncbi:MAG: PQQ-binding-like beta-propeller repeat protein [Candidatus Hydrogenedentes bacterium]|nr:PQQ-binding-like beta-propeller repeat protein [Candidatus Hydrogenedentota bacterium]
MCLLALPAVAPAEPVVANWPQFRGPGARGVADENAIPDRWSATENVAWKTDIPGRAWSSPIVWGNQVFLTTAVDSGQLEAPKKGLYLGGDRKNAPGFALQWKVYCLDLESGKVIWERILHEGKPETSIHLKNSFASETPVTDGKRVYAYFGNLGVWCLDLDGKPVWNKDIPPHKMPSGWGTAASPVLHNNRLYLVNDNEEDSYLLALDALTGKEVWRVPREERGNWCSPTIWTNDKRTEIVVSGSKAVRSYDLDGKLLWSLQGMSGITIATPYATNGLLYISSGYVLDKSRPIYAIRPGATGDISLAQGQTSNEWIAWSQPQAAPYNPSTLVTGDRLYVVNDGGMVSCFNAQTGAEVYRLQQIPDGHHFTASPWSCGGKIFCLDEDGATFVLKAGDKFEVLGKNPLADDDMGMATPAIAGDRLLIRTSARLYCIRNGAKKDSSVK